jgi:hypothetical protein
MNDYFLETRVLATLTKYPSFWTDSATRKISFDAHHRAAIKPASEENWDTERQNPVTSHTSQTCQVSNVIVIIPSNLQIWGLKHKKRVGALRSDLNMKSKPGRDLHEWACPSKPWFSESMRLTLYPECRLWSEGIQGHENRVAMFPAPQNGLLLPHLLSTPINGMPIIPFEGDVVCLEAVWSRCLRHCWWQRGPFYCFGFDSQFHLPGVPNWNPLNSQKPPEFTAISAKWHFSSLRELSMIYFKQHTKLEKCI